MSASKRTVKKSKQGRPPTAPIDWELLNLALSDLGLAAYMKWQGFAVGTVPLQSLILGSKDHCILDRAYAACWYAENVLEGRWEEGELVILEATGVVHDVGGAAQTARLAEAYRKRFFPRRVWPALRERIREGRCTPAFVVEYSCIAGKKCHDDANEGLLKADRNADGFTKVMSDYADGALRDKLPDELHSVMLLKSFERPDDPFVRGYVKTYGM
jgi:hypothetical protein